MKRYISGFLVIALMISLCVNAPFRVNAATMTSSDAFISILKTMEGFSKYPYQDGPQWTVGYGTRCPDDKLEEYKTNGITEAEAQALLEDMLADFENTVNNFASKNSLALSQQQFDALVSFTYNCGGAWTTNSTSTINKAVREGWTGSKFVYAITLYSTASGDYILMNRRLAEANVYLNGIYKASNVSGAIPDELRYVFLDGNGGVSKNSIHGFDTSDPISVITEFSKVPTGKGTDGESFSYEFAGWYTAETGGIRVEVLDSSVPRGAILYAQWKDPNGNIVSLPKGDLCIPVTVTATSNVNIRSGPGTFYEKQGKLTEGEQIVITQTYTRSSTTWGMFDGGWVSLSYTDYADVIWETAIWPKTGTVTGDKVNVRSGPGTNYTSKYKLNTGDAVKIYERQKGGSYYWGKLEDGNWIALQYVKLDPMLPDVDLGGDPIYGDIDGNREINTDDVIRLLLHVSMPEVFPIDKEADFNGDSVVTTDDVIALLLHVSMPEVFPI